MTTQNPPPLQQPTLPSPETFDILPPLQALLSRLLLPSPGLLAPLGEPSHDSPTETNDGTGHLDIQELSAAVGAIRIRIQKARAAVKGLPDIERSMGEQEGEIRELEERVVRMREMLGGGGGV